MSKVQTAEQLQQLINHTNHVLRDTTFLSPPAKSCADNTEEFRYNEKVRIKQTLGDHNTTVIHPNDIIKAFRETVKKQKS